MDWTDSSARQVFVNAETDRALAVLASGREELRRTISRSAAHTDSPIEAQFAAWFDAARAHLLSLGYARFALKLKPQQGLVANEQRYRLDFALEPMDPWLADALTAEHLTLRVGVELDGHDYHEKTRADVTRRNQRDRDLAAANWIVLHFSGSELHRNPMTAVIEVLTAGADALDQAKAALLHG